MHYMYDETILMLIYYIVNNPSFTCMDIFIHRAGPYLTTGYGCVN